MYLMIISFLLHKVNLIEKCKPQNVDNYKYFQEKHDETAKSFFTIFRDEV